MTVVSRERAAHVNISDTPWSFIDGIRVVGILCVLVRSDSEASTAIVDVGHALQLLTRASVAWGDGKNLARPG
jgi:hypothetical protein